MKKILFAVLLMITSISAFSQQKQVLNNQFSDYVQFQKQQQRKLHNLPMRPKPLSVTFKGNRVIVIFKKEDYMRLRPIVNRRIMWKERPRGRV